MNGCHCQSPPAWADEGSWRSRSPAARLPQPELPDGVLDLHALRSRAALLLRGLPRGNPAPAVSRCQPSSPAKPRRPARSSGPATCLPPSALPASRDGSIFPIGHFSGTMRLWRNDHDAGGGRTASSVFGPAGNTGRSVAVLLNLWPGRPLRRSFPPHSTTKVSWDDPSRNPRTDSPLFLRRALENRHDCTSPERDRKSVV